MTDGVNIGDIFRPLGFAPGDDAQSWVDPNGRQLSDRVWQARAQVRDQIDLTLRRGITAGDSPILMARRLEQYLSPSWMPQRNPDTGRLIANQPKQIVTRTPSGAGAGSYAARRLARTETTRALGRAQIAAAERNPFVTALQWRISGRHPADDVCDRHAHDGPFKPRDVPPYPAHPHCLCSLVPVADDTDKVLADIRRQLGLNPPSPGGSLDIPVANPRSEPLPPAYQLLQGRASPQEAANALAGIMEQRWPSIAFDFEGIDTEIGVRQLQESMVEFERLAEKYPEPLERLQYIGTHQGNGPRLGYDWERGGGTAHADVKGQFMGYNPKYYNQDIAKIMRSPSADKYVWVRGVTAPEVTTHEYGHLLHVAFENSRRSFGPIAPDGFGHVGETWRRFVQTQRPSQTLSVYAYQTKNYRGYIQGPSEGFVAIEHNQKPTTYTKRLQKLIDLTRDANTTAVEPAAIARGTPEWDDAIKKRTQQRAELGMG